MAETPIITPWTRYIPASLLIHGAIFGIMAWCDWTPPFIPPSSSTQTSQKLWNSGIPIAILDGHTTSDSDPQFESISPDDDPFVTHEMPQTPDVDPIMDVSATPAPPNVPVTPTPVKDVSTLEHTHMPVPPSSDASPSSEPPASTDPSGNTPTSTATSGNTSASTAPSGNTPGSTAPSGNTPTSTAPSGNTPGSASESQDAAIWRAYTATLSAHFKKKRLYPEMARRLKLTGTVWILVEIRRDGTLLNAQIETSSGSDLLDQAALNSARSSAPVPPFPQGITATSRKVRIPYQYSLR
ncbi:MAG: TonB family protein [Bradymonadia bacterium]